MKYFDSMQSMIDIKIQSQNTQKNRKTNPNKEQGYEYEGEREGERARLSADFLFPLLCCAHLRGMVAYRLEVKGRIYREEQEVLSLYSQKPELRKEKLSEIYNELEQHYLSVIKKARLH